MLFAHIADSHLGGWRHPVLRNLNHHAFETAVQRCLEERVDFVLLSGDLFNTALPSIDSMRIAFEQLRKLKDAAIAVYFIAGSHDFSARGKSVLDVIESAGLGINVARGTSTPEGKLRLMPVVDKKTGITIVGLLGRRGGLDKHYYEALDRQRLEGITGAKIFLFHGSVSELKADDMEQMDSFAMSLLPKGFDYYAGGHVHIVKQHSMPGYLNVVYPGPTFPNNFYELEKLKRGSFCLVKDWNVEHVGIALHPVLSLNIDVDGKTAAEAEAAVRATIPDDVTDTIVLLRVKGCLREGAVADIKFHEILAEMQHPVVVLKNTHALSSKEFEEVHIETGTLEEIEDRLAKEHAGKSVLFNIDEELALVKELTRVLASEKKEGEKVTDYEQRIRLETGSVLNP